MLYFSKIKLIFIYFTIIVLSFFAIINFIDNEENYFLKKNINLGLDLRGGSYLLLEVDTNPIITEKLQSKVILLKEILKKEKINYSNLIFKDRKIEFESKDDEFKKFLKIFNKKNDNSLNNYYPSYRFHELDYDLIDGKISIFYSKYGVIEIQKGTLDQSIEIVRRRIDEAGTKEPTILKRGSNRILIELPGLNEPNRIKKLLGKTANLSFRLVSDSDENTFGTDKLYNEDTGKETNVSKRVLLSGDNLIDAQPRLDNLTNKNVVYFKLDNLGAKKFGRATSRHVGKKLAIVLDNKIVSAPVINEPILGGDGVISGNFTFQSATDLALLLRSGALPTPLNIIEERTVGPDLGEDSVKAGMLSLIIGFLFVISFMVFKYKFFGLVADISLIVNLILLLGILTLLEVTLTLPGIAGIILTVGMAVDANVLIFERIREEKKYEKSNIIAFDVGYKKAQSSIFDANITTLISAIILFFVGSGPVKGFSVTLSIGIITTLFSAYFFARHLTSFYVMRNKEKEIQI